MKFWYGSDCGFGPDPDTDADPAIFVSDLQGVNKKLFFKDKKAYRSHKTVGINVFLTIFP